MSVPHLQPNRRFGPVPAPTGHKGLKKGVYLVPSLFTTMNILAGFYSLMATMSGFRLLGIGGAQQISDAANRFDAAAIAIGLAFVCDMLDGRIARMTKSTTEIGIQLDSLADIVSFGIAPAVLAFAWGYGTALQDWLNATARLVSVIHVRRLRRLSPGQVQCAGDASATDGGRNAESR